MPGCAGITHSRTPTGPEAGNLGSPGVPPGPASLRRDSQRGDQPSCFRMALCHEGPRLGRRQAALHVSPLRGKGLAQHEWHPVAGKAWPAHRRLCPPPLAEPGHSWFPATWGFCGDAQAHVPSCAESWVCQPQLWVQVAYFGLIWSQMLFLESLDISSPWPVAF